MSRTNSQVAEMEIYMLFVTVACYSHVFFSFPPTGAAWVLYRLLQDQVTWYISFATLCTPFLPRPSEKILGHFQLIGKHMFMVLYIEKFLTLLLKINFELLS